LGETQEVIAQYRKTTITALKKELRTDLDWIILKAMEKDRVRRYETANALGQELERHLRNEPVLARAPTARYRARKFLNRHRTGVAFTAAVVILLTAWATSTSVQAGRIALERDRVSEEADKAQAALDFMTRILAAPNPVSNLGPDASVLEALNAAVEEAEGEFSDEPEVDAAIRHEIGRVYLRLGQFEAAAPLLEGALGTRLGLHAEGDADIAETLGLLADVQMTVGNRDSANALYTRSLDLFRRFAEPGDPRPTDIRIRFADLLMASGRFDEAEPVLLEIFERVRDKEDAWETWSSTASRLSILYRTTGDLASAEQFARQANEIRERNIPSDHVLRAESLHNLAVILDDQGKKEEAVEFYTQTLQVYERTYGANSEYVAITLNNLALVHIDLGNDQEAEALFRRALAIDLELFGEDHIGPAVDRLNLGRHLCLTGRLEEGEGMVEAAIEGFESTLDPGQYEIWVARSSRGVCLGAAGRYAEGEKILLEALQGIQAIMGSEHPQLEILRGRLADLYEAWGRPAEAERYRTSG
jgi:tetratricopeptide (TPR) repeat protein